jgi:transcriptional regulator with XRE-family HTH domain
MDDLKQNLAINVKRLRNAHNMSQQQIAKLSGLPRPTWASLESGAANPTLTVLAKVAQALQVSIDELTGAPRNEVEHIPAARVRSRRRQGATITPLVPDALPGLEITRMEIEAGGHMAGIPHTRGTREYLTCECGRIELIAAGQRWLLEEGDMLVFRGDQRHSYRNADPYTAAVAVSAVCFSS